MSPAEFVGGDKLGLATSPYLRQHADNPVHWRQWNPEALAEAAERDVPILLSVGYAACHWCHVMAHESFEDVQVAAVMNAGFPPLLLDPIDFAQAYMQQIQAAQEQAPQQVDGDAPAPEEEPQPQ